MSFSFNVYCPTAASSQSSVISEAAQTTSDVSPRLTDTICSDAPQTPTATSANVETRYVSQPHRITNNTFYGENSRPLSFICYCYTVASISIQPLPS